MPALQRRAIPRLPPFAPPENNASYHPHPPANLAAMSKYTFHFAVSVLTHNAGLLLDALKDDTIGPPVLARLGGDPFKTAFAKLLKDVGEAPATRAGQTGDTGTLTQEQNAALAETRRLDSAARRSAGLALKGQGVVLKQEFKIGNSSGSGLADEIADAKVIQTATVKYATQLGTQGWTAQDSTDLENAIGGLDGVDLTQEASKKKSLDLTAAAVDDANQLYAQCLALENAARLQFPSTKKGNEGTRARYLIGIFPPTGHNPPPPADPPAGPTPTTPPSASP